MSATRGRQTTPRRLSPARGLAALGGLVIAAIAASWTVPVGATEAPELPEHARLAALADEARAHGDSALGMAPLLAMGDLQGWLLPLERAALYAAVADDVSDPHVRALAQYRALRALFEGGAFDQANALEAEMGFITRWRIIGPFPNDGMAGLNAALPPEQDGVFDGEVDGKRVPVAWRALDGASETGYVALSDLLQPAHDAVAYAATSFSVRRATDATLSLAVDGAYRVWLDGEPLVGRDTHWGGFLMRDEIDVRLERGTHTLLFKLAADDEPMGFHARLLDGDGTPLPLAFAPAESLPTANGTDTWPAPRSIAETVAASAVEGDALAEAARIARALQPNDSAQPWRELAERAAAMPLTAVGYRALADVAEESWVRDEHLRAAAEASGAPLDRLAVAEAMFRHMGEAEFELAVEEAERLCALETPPAGARLLQARALLGRGLARAAYHALEELAGEVGHVGPLLGPLEDAARDIHRFDRMEALFQHALDTDVASVGLYDDLAAFARTRGDLERVEALIAQLRAALPRSPLAAEQEVWIRRGDGDIDGAMEALDRALSLAPGNADLHALRGRIALESGDRAAAVAAFEAALALRPQEQSLRDLVESIAPSGDRFYTAYAFDLDQIRGLRNDVEAVPDAAYTALVDQQVTRVFPNGLATRWVQRAFDVHTRSGADALRVLQLGYTPDAEVVEVLSVNVIKPDGRVLEVFDVDDYGSGSGPSSIYYDVHARVLSFPNLEPGDTLVYSYTLADIAFQNLFDDYFGDVWFVRDDVPRRFVRYALHAPTRRPIFTGGTASVGAWEVSEVGDETIRVYTAEDVPRVEHEAGAPGPSESFEYLSVSTYETWDALANWYWNLVREQLIAGPEIVATVESLIEGVDDPRDQIAAIYGYVVRNTRYVGLEFGIHGYKPYRTTDCFTRRFGDCKDTASLMKVMLEIAGIEAHLALVRTRDMGRVDTTPPSLAVFNHAITYVPEYDLFLDGTAGFSGSGELPTMDQGASALVVLDGEGGDFRTIAALPASASVSRTDAEVDLRGDAAAGRGALTLSGGFAPSARSTYESPQRRVERFQVDLARTVPGIEVTHLDIAGVDDIETPVHAEFEFVGGQWGQRQGAEFVVDAFGDEAVFASRYAGADERTLPLSIPFAFEREVALTLRVPESWRASGLPEDVTLDTPFGGFTRTVASDGDALVVRFVATIDALRVEPDEYPAFRAFLQSVDAALSDVIRFDTSGTGEVAQ